VRVNDVGEVAPAAAAVERDAIPAARSTASVTSAWPLFLIITILGQVATCPNRDRRSAPGLV
jgi:hypothetical protein